ncbi:winged helix-turn-helix domain-containing protein [Saccharothrix sp. ALI-22-I]|uniref:winged helix-turn-helix domain-containing protein n=1 Tax=Saccharothrix sp. ALI-22-I TaxID=1933778 RepID=UPI00097C0BFE|nr:winged helix-turn-helix domain-containing protein [Saccharothrix sp. ALI-22-I]
MIELKLSPENHTVTTPDGARARLTPAEFRVLAYLLANRGRVLTVEEITTATGVRCIRSAVSKLRYKLGPARLLIHGVYGIGYLLREHV